MVNKALSTFILLSILSSAFAFKNDPEVFKIMCDDTCIACAELDKDYAVCWQSFTESSKLHVNQSEKQKIQPIYGDYYHQIDTPFHNPNDSSSYALILKELVIKILNKNYENPDDKNYLIAKIRAFGASIYINHGHSGMMEVCENLPTARGIRRLAESYWDGIGYWLG